MSYSDNAPPTSKNSLMPNPQHLGSPQPPPSYGHYQAYPYSQQTPILGYTSAPPPRQSVGRRFLRALAFAAVIWLLLTVLVRSSVTAIRWVHHRGDLILDGWDYTIPAGVALETCVQGDEWSPSGFEVSSFNNNVVNPYPLPYKSETSFSLPLSSETLFFLSRGQLLSGVVNVVTDPEQAKDSATVKVAIRYLREEIRDLAKACLITREEGETGIGIFSPVWHYGRYPRGNDYRLSYEMVIVLPELSGKSAPLIIKNFKTDVHNSVHVIDDLNEKVLFGTISLSGSNGPIRVTSLAATTGSIHTSNGPITGTFNTTSTLSLTTSNSPIRIDVGLESDKHGSSPVLVARTSNGGLEADVSLLSASDSPSTFDVSTTTSNSPLRVTFPASPADSTLTLKASTSNSPATVSLNPAYEGTFDLRTSSRFATTIRGQDPEDPSGNGRKRHIKSRNISKGVLVGEISWEPTEKAAKGVVQVRTSNSPVVLEV